jgi:hypothetical protein
MPLSLLNHSDAHSHFCPKHWLLYHCTIWVCIRSSSSSCIHSRRCLTEQQIEIAQRLSSGRRDVTHDRTLSPADLYSEERRQLEN